MRLTFLIIYFTLLASCIAGFNGIKKECSKGRILLKTNFYDPQGNVVVSDTIKLWYYDSAVIQDLHIINRKTDTAKRTTVSLDIFAYRYIDLRTKTVYDYSSFSDTAILLTKRFLPDTMFMDYGWNFNQISKVVGNPVELSDTTIENVNYKRAKFSTEEYDKDKVYQIGYFTCDNKGLLFSLKKSFSFKPNCTMTKIFGYNVGVPTPFASKELVFVSEELSNYEKQVFKSWKQNIKLFPVNQ